jgi:hypothetical protein
MNNEQQNTHKKAYVAAQTDYLDKLAQHCDYALTLQTNLPTYGISAATMEKRLDATRNCLHKFRMRFNRLLTGNGHRRNNDYLPVFIAAIEGTQNTYDKNRTLHIHIALGNLPAAATQELLEDGIRQIWAATDVGTTDIKLDRLTKGTEQRWNSYIGKEAHYKNNSEVIDYSNTQAPNKILATI